MSTGETSPVTQLRTWLKSSDRIFVPTQAERLAQGQALGLSRTETQAVLASEPELTRLSSGRIPKSREGFRLRKFSEAEVDIGFLNYNAKAYGLFFLGKEGGGPDPDRPDQTPTDRTGPRPIGPDPDRSDWTPTDRTGPRPIGPDPDPGGPLGPPGSSPFLIQVSIGCRGKFLCEP